MKGELKNITAVNSVLNRILGEKYPPYDKLGVEPCEFYQCLDCGEVFFKAINEDRPRCNGVLIDLCPYCREDSEPGKYGR